MSKRQNINPDQFSFEASPEVILSPEQDKQVETYVDQGFNYPQAFHFSGVKDLEPEDFQMTRSEPHTESTFEPLAETIYGAPGSYIPLSNAKYVKHSLIALGKRNQREGLDYGAQVEPMSREIRGRYGRNTSKVLKGARENEKRFLKEAKASFWEATGLVALEGTGMIDREQRDAIGRKMWRDFTSEYSHAGPTAVKKRNKYKRQLNKHIKRTERQDLQDEAA